MQYVMYSPQNWEMVSFWKTRKWKGLSARSQQAMILLLLCVLYLSQCRSEDLCPSVVIVVPVTGGHQAK